MNALIVDDDPVVRMLASKMLEVKNYIVLNAEDEESLRAYLASHPIAPDVILLDLQIGDLSGVDAANLIIDVYKKVPRIICMSSHAAYEAMDLYPTLSKIVHDGRNFDFDRDFLQKPFHSASLYAILS